MCLCLCVCVCVSLCMCVCVYFNLAMFQTYACSHFKVFKLDCVYVVVVAVFVVVEYRGFQAVNHPSTSANQNVTSNTPQKNRKNGRHVFRTSLSTVRQ